MKAEVGETFLSVGLCQEARMAVLASKVRPTDRNVCPTSASSLKHYGA